MWSIRRVKEVAKARFKSNYWKCVLVISVFMGMIGGVGSITASLPSGDENTKKNLEQVWDRITTTPGQLALFIGVVLIGMIIGFMIGLALGFVLDAFLYNPLRVGIAKFTYRNLGEKAKVRDIAYAFDGPYKKIVSVMFHRELICFLWGLLFIIPGIYKSYQYRLVPYLLAENPNLTKQEALEESKRMMDGNKGKAFLLDLSFIGWDILGILTIGILMLFYVQPYKEMANAAMYDAIKFDKCIAPAMNGATN